MENCKKNATENYEAMRFRSALHCALFEPMNALRWYQRRDEPNAAVMKAVLLNIIKMVAPITPHLSEEMWRMAGNKRFISIENWPKPDKRAVNKEAEAGEEFLRKTIDDMKNIMNMVKNRTKQEPKAITLFVAESRKFKPTVKKKKQMAFLSECQSFLERETNYKVAIVDADKIVKSKKETNLTIDKAKKAMPDKLGILIE
jgi:leucyl-tRNA synthetase